jgi:hypothetical protein
MRLCSHSTRGRKGARRAGGGQTRGQRDGKEGNAGEFRPADNTLVEKFMFLSLSIGQMIGGCGAAVNQTTNDVKETFEVRGLDPRQGSVTDNSHISPIDAQTLVLRI